MKYPRLERVIEFAHRGPHAMRHEFAAGITVALGALGALAWSAGAERSYFTFIGAPFHSSWLHSVNLDSLRQLSTNGVLTIFFFAVGLELSKEFRIGSMRQRHQAVLPVLGALGGMIACALSYFVLGRLLGNTHISNGWGIPMATDIAFTLGALSLVRNRIPHSLRIFLLALAVADDLFSVVVLAAKSTGHTSVLWMMGFVAVLTACWLLRRHLGIWHYLVALIVAWATLIGAHIEPALAGVAIGALVPFASTNPGHRLEQIVQPISNAVALPLFAFCACGIAWRAVTWNASTTQIVLGLVGARLVGKLLGISLIVTLARRLGVRGPAEIRGTLLLGASALCAIGFTVPLLFAGQIYGSLSPAYYASTIGLLVASILATVLGVGVLRIARRGNQNSLGWSRQGDHYEDSAH